ncbi:MAG: DUF4232 domain-containing protein [Actinomycetales bacterium]|nr:DUF4232 domain-containing protein [Actinomycetales bacterium]
MRPTSRLILITLPLLAVALVGIASGSAVGASSAPRVARSPSTLTSTSLGLSTEVDSVDMVNSTTGFAVVSNAAESTINRFYLAKTISTGTSWITLGPLPYKSFKGPTAPSMPTLNFVTTSVGYVTAPSGGRVFVTNDGGRIWNPVSTPGIWPTIQIRGNSALIVSDKCTGPLPDYGPLRCPSVVSTYRLGATKPEATNPIPAVNHTAWRAAIALAVPTPSTFVVQEGGTQPGMATHLLDSTNDGRTWHPLKDPCGQLLIQQLLTPSPMRWLLSCFLDGGMMQGTNKLYESRDGGRRWTLLSYSGEQRFYVGNIADTWNTLVLSGNSQMIFSAVGGAAGGIERSADGRHWIPARFNPASGGAPEWIDSFGATGVLFGNQSGNVWRTFNGLTWAPLKLIAGRFRGLPICTPGRGVSVTLGPVRLSAGSSLNTIIFTNNGQHGCYLDGAPSLQPTSGAAHEPAGPPAASYAKSGQGGFTVLRAHGGMASVTLTMQKTSAMRPGSCRTRRATSAIIGFNPPARFLLSFGRLPRTVCALVTTSQVSGVVRGIANGP